MKKLILSCFLVFAMMAANAQYKHSLGLAFGLPSGFCYKTFTSNFKALDFTLGGLGNYFTLSGMYEIHAPLDQDLKWYYGPGAHLGSWSGDNYGSGAFLGVDGVVGIEYCPDIPFAFAADLRPGINIIGNSWDHQNHWLFLQSQLSIRYIFR